MTNYSRSVLKSNGLCHSKNSPVKFGFSPKIVPAYIVKKLPSQRCPPTTSHPDFQLLAQTAHVRFHRRKRVHARLCQQDRTQRPTRRNRGVSDGGAITTLGAFRRFTNIPGPGIRTANFAAFGSWSETLPKNTESLRDSDALMRVAVPRRRGPAGLRDPVVRPLMLRFSVSVRKVSAQSPVNATRSSSHLNPSTTQPSSKNRTQRLTRRNVCALDVAILGDSCYTDGHRKPLKKFFYFF